MLRDWLADAALLCTMLLLVLYCASPRASPCLGRSPLVRLACCLPCSSLACSSLACCWLCSSACCWLCSSRFSSSSLQVFVFCSLFSCSCCFTSFVLTTGSLAVVLLGFSPLAPWLWFRLCFFFRVTLWQVTTPWLVSGFPPTSLLSTAPSVIDGSR